MNICILSDIHDHVWNLKKTLSMQELQATEAMVFCGDLCAPFVVKILGQSYASPIHMVLGNNDGDLAAIIANAASFAQIKIHGEYFKGELGGKRIAVNHYPDKARKLAEVGGFDLVCYGHNHIQSKEKVGDTLLLNPGPIMGFHGGRLEDIPATFLTLNTKSMVTKIYNLAG